MFAAFGLFMGYLLPSENVMQILGPVLALLAFAGGLFIPLSQMDSHLPGHRQVHADVRPERARPRAADRRRAAARLVVNLLAWLAIFGVGAAWRFRKDTARV